jgi:hypothetical protein
MNEVIAFFNKALQPTLVVWVEILHIEPAIAYEILDLRPFRWTTLCVP